MSRIAYQRSIAERKRVTLKEVTEDALRTYLEAVELPENWPNRAP